VKFPRATRLAGCVAEDRRVPEALRAGGGELPGGSRMIAASRSLVRVIARKSFRAAETLRPEHGSSPGSPRGHRSRSGDQDSWLAPAGNPREIQPAIAQVIASAGQVPVMNAVRELSQDRLPGGTASGRESADQLHAGPIGSEACRCISTCAVVVLPLPGSPSSAERRVDANPRSAQSPSLRVAAARHRCR